MTSRMRETSMEPALEEAGVGISPDRVVISSGAMGFLLYMRRTRSSTGRSGSKPRLRTKVALAPEIGQALIREVPGRATKDTQSALVALR